MYQENDNDNDPGEPRQIVTRTGSAGVTETHWVRDESSHSHDWEVLLAGLQVTGGGVLGVPGQHPVYLTHLTRLQASLHQELLQPFSHLNK